MLEKLKSLVNSRKFIAAVLSVVTIASAHFIPNFSVDEEALTSAVALMVAYITGVAIDPGVTYQTMAEKWKAIFNSRKFRTAFFGTVFMLLKAFKVVPEYVIPEDQLVLLTVTLSGYIMGVALEGFRQNSILFENVTFNNIDTKK